jgi:uncharacterized protein YneF (UPF0154 family)
MFLLVTAAVLVGMLLTGVFASKKSINSIVGDNQGLILRTTLF